jgi:anti-sigma factor RsiW
MQSGSEVMTADEARELFSAAYDGELTADERKLFDLALAQDQALAAEYREFSAMLDGAHSEIGHDQRNPDLLAGVQRRLRVRSRGRFYSDKFAERVGIGLLNPLTIAVAMTLLAAAAWLVFGYLQSVDLRAP